jgi:hypothetical protein
MKIKLFTIYDNVAKIFEVPFPAHNSGVASRAVVDDARNNPNGRFAVNGRCYVLHELGSYDDSNGSFELEAAPLPVANVADLVSSSKE